MLNEATMRLPDRLRICAELWVDAQDASLAKLGRLAVKDSSFFNRNETPQGPSTATLERFARFLGDAGNWPDGAVPGAVREFVHVTGIAAPGGDSDPPAAVTTAAAGVSGKRAGGAEAGEAGASRLPGRARGGDANGCEAGVCHGGGDSAGGDAGSIGHSGELSGAAARGGRV